MEGRVYVVYADGFGFLSSGDPRGWNHSLPAARQFGDWNHANLARLAAIDGDPAKFKSVSVLEWT